MGLILYRIINYLNILLIHLTHPELLFTNTIILIPFIVIIKSISLIICPLTLFILTANIIAGHLLLTLLGFQGIHVIIGTLFLSICLIRLYKIHFSSYHHFRLETAS
ncbi:Cytochrome c oxidase subunit 3 [Atta colombica]|uniref:Cytochrome c oxidase subunit 3 n=1 Tax=Atta colombica TaxID=520822 RepID=A0A151I3E6_9HYME|nr:Cytochrome c oxidase subunit 3 [Atta colombica]